MSDPLDRAHGMVLRRVPYRDKDLILTLLLDNGATASALARGARGRSRRFDGALDAFREAEYVFAQSRGDMLTLKEASLVREFRGLTTTVHGAAAAAVATELVRQIAQDGIANPPYYHLLRAAYSELEHTTSGWDAECVLHRLTMLLLTTSGLEPALDRCGCCGKPAWKMSAFLVSHGGEGMVCEACRNDVTTATPADPETLRALWTMVYDTESFEPESVQTARQVDLRRLVDVLRRPLLASPLRSYDTFLTLAR